jgi:hypothetical protein
MVAILIRLGPVRFAGRVVVGGGVWPTVAYSTQHERGGIAIFDHETECRKIARQSRKKDDFAEDWR